MDVCTRIHTHYTLFSILVLCLVLAHQKALLVERPDLHLRSLQQGWIRILILIHEDCPEVNLNNCPCFYLVVWRTFLHDTQKICIAVHGDISVGDLGFELQHIYSNNVQGLDISQSLVSHILGIGLSIGKYRLHRFLGPMIISFLLLDFGVLILLEQNFPLKEWQTVTRRNYTNRLLLG